MRTPLVVTAEGVEDLQAGSTSTSKPPSPPCASHQSNAYAYMLLLWRTPERTGNRQQATGSEKMEAILFVRRPVPCSLFPDVSLARSADQPPSVAALFAQKTFAMFEKSVLIAASVCSPGKHCFSTESRALPHA